MDTRITVLEEINRKSDFPNSLTSLIEENLNQQLKECINKINSIEKIENELMKQV